LIADDAATTSDGAAPATASDAPERAAKAADGAGAKRRATPARLTKPWNQLTGLSEDQKKQIRQIHRKSVDEVKAIEARERDDIMALLSDAQRAELKGLEEKAAADRKTKAAQQKAEKSAAVAKDTAATEEAGAGK
jgi:hypothetical protein